MDLQRCRRREDVSSLHQMRLHLMVPFKMMRKEPVELT